MYGLILRTPSANTPPRKRAKSYAHTARTESSLRQIFRGTHRKQTSKNSAHSTFPKRTRKRSFGKTPPAFSGLAAESSTRNRYSLPCSHNIILYYKIRAISSTTYKKLALRRNFEPYSFRIIPHSSAIVNHFENCRLTIVLLYSILSVEFLPRVVLHGRSTKERKRAAAKFGMSP